MTFIGPDRWSAPALTGLMLVALLTLGGCATSTESSSPSRPGAGLAEYTELVQHSRSAVESALQSLENLRRQPAPCSPTALSEFSAEVDRLAVESVQVRARSQAMQARGDAYFENWQANLAQVSDPTFRRLAEEHRADLQQGLANIKRVSLQIREAFQSFLAGLRKLRGTVEKDPNAIPMESTQSLARETQQSGLKVEQGLDAVAGELRAMTHMLFPNRAEAKE